MFVKYEPKKIKIVKQPDNPYGDFQDGYKTIDELIKEKQLKK